MEPDHAVLAPAAHLCHPEVGWGPAARPQHHPPKMVMMGQMEPSQQVRVIGLRGPMERNSTESCIPSAQDEKGLPHSCSALGLRSQLPSWMLEHFRGFTSPPDPETAQAPINPVNTSI